MQISESVPYCIPTNLLHRKIPFRSKCKLGSDRGKYLSNSAFFGAWIEVFHTLKLKKVLNISHNILTSPFMVIGKSEFFFLFLETQNF
jgi:hypothetical protein